MSWLQDKALIKMKGAKTKYPFIDRHNDLRNKEFNLTLVWNVMPRVGYLYTRSQSANAGKLPGE